MLGDEDGEWTLMGRCDGGNGSAVRDCTACPLFAYAERAKLLASNKLQSLNLWYCAMWRFCKSKQMHYKSVIVAHRHLLAAEPTMPKM